MLFVLPIDPERVRTVRMIADFMEPAVAGFPARPAGENDFFAEVVFNFPSSPTENPCGRMISPTGATTQLRPSFAQVPVSLVPDSYFVTVLVLVRPKVGLLAHTSSSLTE